jgi:gliding motility-associated-like protein
MNKKIIFLLSSLLVAAFSAYSQPTISCPGVDAGQDTSLINSVNGCIQLTAVPVSGFQPTTYTVAQIPYNPYPFNVGTSIIINQDDVWGPVTTLPFDFCFYGGTYNQAQPGSNGLVSFVLNTVGSYCPWPINAPIPDPLAPLNCIMGPWHDINPSFGGNVYAQMYGVAPCRVFVVSWFSNAMFSCTGLFTTQQIAIYETTNIIEVYIQDKPLCTTWNGGASILGVHNATGTQAVVAPGRNFPNQWSAVNEGWRWEPAGASNHTVSWYEVGNPTPIATTDTVTVCPVLCNNYYESVATYTNCNGAVVIVRDTVFVAGVAPNAFSNPTITNVSCFGGTNGAITISPTGLVQPLVYNWPQLGSATPTVSNLAAGVYNVLVTDSSGCSLVDSFEVIEPTQVVPNATATDALCFGATTGTATAAPTGGTPGYTYNWSGGGGTNATATNLGAGQYIVTVTDQNGCTALDTVQVNQPTQVIASTTMVPALCNGQASGQATASAVGGTPGYTYSWSPSGQSTATATNLAAGLHTVTVTDLNGCTSISSTTVTQPSAMSALTNQVNVSCFGGSNGSASVITSGGTPSYTYAWSPSGGSGATANNLTAGNYTCTITDANGCTITRSFVILEPSPLTVVGYMTPEICAGFCNGTASAVAGGGTPPYTYTWSTGATVPSISNLCSGVYSVTVVDAQGCVANATTTVTANPNPIADAGADVSFCEGTGGAQLNGSASGGGGSPYYFTWTCNLPPCGLSCVNCPDPIANPTDTTVYYLVVTDQNGCSSPMDSVVVNVLPKPIVNAGPDTAICGVPAPCVVLTPSISNGFGPYTYQWLPSLGLNDATILNPCARPDTTTIYALVVTDLSTGCTSDYTTTDTLSTVEVTVSPVPIADAGPNRVICDGDSTQLQGIGTGAGPNYDFQWSPVSGLSNYAIINPLAFPALTTNYTLVVWSNGCPSYADTVVVYVTEIPTVDAGQDRDICMGDSAFLDGSASIASQVIADSVVSYAWTPPAGLSTTTVPDVMASPAQTGLYYLTATTAQGCTNLDSVLVTINPSPIIDAGPNLTVCAGSGPWNLNGSISWYNGVAPGDLQNVIIEWQPAQHVVGPNDVEDIQVNPDQTMYFYFTVTYNTCTATDSVLVTVVSELHPIAEADTNVICSGDSVGLHVTGGLGGGTVTWTPGGSLDDPTSTDPTAAPAATTTYIVTMSESGCMGVDSVTVQVIETPKVAFVSTFTEGCAPIEVVFTSLTADGILLTWDFGDGAPRENGSTVTHIFDSAGTYPVMLWGTNTGGCSDSSDVPTIVTVHDTVVPAFHSDPNYPVEMTVPGGEVHFFDDTPGATDWLWNFGTGFTSTAENPTYSFSTPGTYFVTLLVENEHGCAGTVVHGPYIVTMPELFIPNVFSPNGDGFNDVFLVQYSGNQRFKLSVFDRWGVQLHSTNNKMAGWDGKNQDSEVVEGVYYYEVKVGDRDYTGNITLVR